MPLFYLLSSACGRIKRIHDEHKGEIKSHVSLKMFLLYLFVCIFGLNATKSMCHVEFCRIQMWRYTNVSNKTFRSSMQLFRLTQAFSEVGTTHSDILLSIIFSPPHRKRSRYCGHIHSSRNVEGPRWIGFLTLKTMSQSGFSTNDIRCFNGIVCSLFVSVKEITVDV